MKTILAKLVAAAIVALSVSGAAWAVDPATLAAQAPDVITDGEIATKALELGNDPVRIYEFVRNEFTFEIYYGLMKGPVATLRSRAGNDYDLAALLVSLLRSAGIPAQFVRGRVAIPSADAAAWTGANNAAAAQVMFINTQPPGWNGNLVATAPNGNLEILHIWVEAYVPLGSYRGFGGNADLLSRGQAWVPLDPSFKLRKWNPDPGLPFGQQPAYTFDYDAYYDDVQAKLPVEVFEDQLRKQFPSGDGYDHIAFTGPIVKEAPGVLPTALPYQISPALTPARHASLVNLHTFGAGGLSPSAAAGDDGAPDYRYERRIWMCKNGVEDCELAATPAADRILTAKGWSADWNGKRLTIWFPPTPASASQLKPVGYAASNCKGLLGVDIFTFPRVSADGVTQVTSTTQVKLCDPLEVVVEIGDPLECDRTLTQPKAFNIKAGEINVASFDESGVSDAEVAEEGARLAALMNDYPLAQDPAEDLAFIDSDRDGTKDESEIYLAAAPETDELLTGQLLHLAHTWYWNKSRAGDRRIDELHQLRTSPIPGYGRVTSGREVEYLLDLPFGIKPSNLLIDLASASVFITRAGGNPATDHAFRLGLNHGSALEHAVWEEVAGVGAVSTVQGFQLGLDLTENHPSTKLGLLTIETFAEATAEVQGRCNADGCNKSFGGSKGLDETSYCTIWRSFHRPGSGQSLPDPAGMSSSCAPVFPDVTKDLRILNRSNFDYDGWEGFVYARFASNGPASSGEMAISATSANGGFAVLPPVDPFNLVQSPLTDIRGFSSAGSWDTAAATSLLVTANDPVSVTHGSYYETHTDLEIPGPGGMNLRFVRSYNSRLANQGQLGYGWMHTFDQHLREDNGGAGTGDDKVIWVTENATEIVWKKPGGVLTPELWNHDDLVKNANGTYTLTTKSGMRYEFLAANNGKARLDRMVDRNGNTITVHWKSSTLTVDYVVDAAGRVLEFDYDIDLTSSPFNLRDWTGRTWRYKTLEVHPLFDPSWDLIEYRDPEQKIWKYEYYNQLENTALNHNIKRYRKPTIRVDGQYVMFFEYYPNDSVYRHVDSLGREARFSYNFFRKRTDVFNPDGGVESYFYDGFGNITRYQSAEGLVTEYVFGDPERRHRTEEIDPLGNTTRLNYDLEGNVTDRTNRFDDVEEWTYNAFGKVLVHTDMRGNETQSVYDATGVNVLEERADLNGIDKRLLRSYSYDTRGNRTRAREWFSSTRELITDFVYDPDTFFLIRIEDPDDNQTRITPDELGRPIRIERDRLAGPFGSQTNQPVVVTREYDRLDRVVRETDPGGLVRSVIYDANGLPVQVRSIVEYDRSAPVIRLDQWNLYDAMDRRIWTQDALGNATTFEYDDRDRLTKATTPMGKVVETVYDLDGRPVEAIDPIGAVTSTEYDPLGRPIVVTDALGRKLETTYDREGRPFQKKEAGRIVFQSPFYDEVGHLQGWTDAASVRTGQTFDELGRRRTVTTAIGTTDLALVQFEYDYPGRLIKKIDGNANQTLIAYDDLGRVQTVTDALARTRAAYIYDQVGNVTQVTDGAGKIVRREYDARGNVTLEHDVSTGLFAQFRYDRRGRLVWSMGPDGGVESYAYDDLDRRIERVDALGGVERFVYDADGQLRQHVQLPIPGAASEIVINYDYDARGLLAAIRDPQAGVFQFEADAIGRSVRRTGPGGGEWRASYTPTGEVDAVEVAFGNQTELTDYLTFDARGYPRTSVTRSFTGGTQTNAENLEYQYTPVGRLDRVCRPNCTSTVLESYTYDDVGNRLTSTSETGPGRTYQYDAANQLTQITNTSTGAVIDSFGHDGAGRRTSWTTNSVTTTYTYDGLGRLKTQTRPGYSATLDYGGLGRRTKRVEGSVTAQYPTPRLEVRGPSTFRLLRAGGVGNVVAEVEGTNTYFLHRDASQNISQVTRTTSPSTTPTLETASRRWTAFGTPRPAVTSAIERGYASQASEGATGLLYMGARHYDPATGRFLQPDPLGVAVDELYAYASNNPINSWDPTGLMPQSAASGGFLDQRLSFGGGLAVAGAGAAATVGLGYGAAAILGATGCIASVVCGAAVAAGAVGVVGYDLYNGGASRIADSFSAVWHGDSTVGQALETGGVATGVAGLAGVGVRAAGSLAVREAANAGTPLFRAVMQGELDDIATSGAFRNPYGIENKYFSTTAEGAASYARQASRAFGDGPFSIVETRIPTGAITAEMRAVVDRGIQTVTVPTQALELLSAPKVWNVMPIPIK
jgi:RHS repeat-associated protein